jgi:hypothetical protein
VPQVSFDRIEDRDRIDAAQSAYLGCCAREHLDAEREIICYASWESSMAAGNVRAFDQSDIAS